MVSSVVPQIKKMDSRISKSGDVEGTGLEMSCVVAGMSSLVADLSVRQRVPQIMVQERYGVVLPRRVEWVFAESIPATGDRCESDWQQE